MMRYINCATKGDKKGKAEQSTEELRVVMEDAENEILRGYARKGKLFALIKDKIMPS